MILEDNGSVDVSVNHTAVTWYEARNECLRRGWDLFTSHNIAISAHIMVNASYWVGLRNVAWRWQTSDDISK